MQPIELPTLLFWENGNTWYGSKGQARFFIRLERPEEGEAVLKVQLWRGPLTLELSEVLTESAFPLGEEGLARLTDWLEDQAARLNA